MSATKRAPAAVPTNPAEAHLPVLDGVRALSIVAVLVTHLLPVHFAGESWNASVGMFGMSLFFVLSGLLITAQLLKRPPAAAFLVRRLFRIVPAAWLCLALVLLFVPMDLRTLASYLGFYANLPPQTLVRPIDHFWSLCVEVQFYVFSAALLLFRPRLAAWAFPLLLLATTALRVARGPDGGSVTWYRIDDVLAGATLAIAFASSWRAPLLQALRRPALVWMLLALLMVSSVLPDAGINALAYLRPYFAALFVGALIAQPKCALARVLVRPSTSYIAAISYALYIWHLPLAATWLGSGDGWEKYLKRPLLLLVLWGVAHVSTVHFERPFIRLGKRVEARLASAQAPRPGAERRQFE